VNYRFLAICAILTICGFLFLATLSAPASMKEFGNTNYYLFSQAKKLISAIILAFIAFFIPLKFLKKISPWLLLLNFVLLLAVFLPVVGLKFWGAQRWLNIGGFVLQPSEFLKITSILYLSAWISNRMQENSKNKFVLISAAGLHNFKYIFIPFIIFLGAISIILLKQPDLTTLAIIIATLVALYFSAKTSFWHIILIGFMGFIALVLLVRFEPYRLQRFSVFLHPETDPMGIGYQIKQSLIAVGSGGFFGKGIGMSSQKFGFLPQAMTDSVFAVLAEETGIFGASALIILFIIFLWQGIKIARNSNDKFSQLTAFGIVFWITFQAFVNISSAVGIFPVSGVPLPFFSYGGSHLLTELIACGLLLNISRNS
jgi:cell division protein FtsW